MPEAGEYILAHVGFSPSSEPFIILQNAVSQVRFNPFGKVLTLAFNTSTKHCVGWYDLASGDHAICPEGALIDRAHTQCPACQKRTGFNPAFYNAASVSPQQEARNAQPHLLYLAHFGKDVIKVGISHAARKTARLLEQGARSAIILDTFPTAIIARQYEAKIAGIAGIAETIQHRKKQELLQTRYSVSDTKQELEQTKQQIESIVGVSFSGATHLTFDELFFTQEPPNLSEAYDTSTQAIISGHVIGMVGTLLYVIHHNSVLTLPVKKFVGYKVIISYDQVDITLPARQMTLF